MPNNSNNTMFFIQYKSMGSSSHGIRSGGVILNIGDLLDVEYMRKLCKGSFTIFYQTGRAELKTLKSMRLDEFKAIFVSGGHINKMSHLLTDIGEQHSILDEQVFRKEITDMYGTGQFKVKMSKTTKYKVGDMIETDNGETFVYCGNMESLSISMRYIDGRFSSGCTYSGHLYLPVNKNNEDMFDMRVEFAKYMRVMRCNYSKYEKRFLKNKKPAVSVNSNITFNVLEHTGKIINNIGITYMSSAQKQVITWEMA